MTTTTAAAAVLSGPADPLLELLLPVLDDLADAVEAVGEDDLPRPTPCAGYDVAGLRDHAVGWLDFFAAALADPEGTGVRPDPTAYTAATDGREPADVVREAARSLAASVRDGVHRRPAVRLWQADLPGSVAVGMILGEYLVHGWDLRRALGLPWEADPRAADAAREVLAAMMRPEYRGGPDGMFGEEVAVPAGAPAGDRLLGFAGRDPRWTP